MAKIKKALISVSDKEGLLPLAQMLKKFNIEIIASGGTATTLEKAGIAITPVEKLTGKPEVFQGRMKTLSFEIASALLYRRDQAQDRQEAQQLGIEAIDLVIVNLYPFRKTLQQGGTFAECVEKIDIGGPTLLRAAAKNFADVSVLCEPSQYGDFMKELEAHQGETTLPSRQKWASRVFAMTTVYDMDIAHFMMEASGENLRYGENPHQKGALLKDPFVPQSLAQAPVLHGKEMSYNNYLDADFAWNTLRDLQTWMGTHAHPAVVVVKHNTPCGIAVAETTEQALQKAWDGDSKSSFGGVLALNFPLDATTAAFFKERFVEVIMAPQVTKEAVELLAKKNCRLLQMPLLANEASLEVRSVDGGLLLQDKDLFSNKDWKAVTTQAFPENKKRLAEFAMLCVKNLKSNAISVVRESSAGLELVAIGAGQCNRVDCIEKLIGPRLLDKNKTDLSDCVLGSDAFFPFADSVTAAAKLGIRMIVQPGGSMRDSEVVAEADQKNVAMMMTGVRHFRH